MTTLAIAHINTSNCGAEYGKAKNWLESAKAEAAALNAYCVLEDGKAYFYDKEMFSSKEVFHAEASAAFDLDREESFDDDVLVIA